MKPEPLHIPVNPLSRRLEDLLHILAEKERRIRSMHEALLYIAERGLLDKTLQAKLEEEQRVIGAIHRNKEILEFVELLISQKHGGRSELMKVHNFLLNGGSK